MEPSRSSSTASSSSAQNKRKHQLKKSSSDSRSHLDRQQRRDLRRIKNSLKKYDPKSFDEINREQQYQEPTNSNVHLTEASTSAVSSSSNSQINRPSKKERRERRKQEKQKDRTSINQDNLSGELRHYLGSAIKNSLGHMHDHIIATLPTEMSLYYQKVHDTLLLDIDHDGDNVSNPNLNPASGRQMMNEMHEFITASSVAADVEASSNRPSSSSNLGQQEQATSNVHSLRSQHSYYTMHNPYAPPMHKPGILPIRDFLHDPLNASLNTLNRVTNLVRVPTSQIYSHGYNILNNLASPVNNHPSTLPTVSRPPGTAERIVRRDDEGIPAPPPVLPLIQCTHPQTRHEPLDLEEFEEKTWTIELLRQRGISEKLRLRLWPYILGLYDGDNDNEDCRKQFDWSSKQKLFEHYRSQWQSILPEQEKRFMLFRERKSLIERDVIRCDRAHPFYNGDRNENLDKLKEILLTYMMYDFDTGYVQGMSDLVSPLLYVAEGDTCKAFWFFVQTMEFTNNNFEMSQLTIKHQLEMLWKLIELTDPIFAQYLANNESVNCYFAFRWIVCQFKREFMKSNSDDYQEVLLLWESIWTCSSMKKYYKNLLRQQLNNIDGDNTAEIASDLANKIDEQCKIVEENSESIDSTDSQESMTTTYSGVSRRLSDTELYVLCICLAIIRRERDLIMVQRFDATEILKHFNTLQLTTNLKNILIHAANIWSWLIFDDNEKLLYASSSQAQSSIVGDNQTRNRNVEESHSSNISNRDQSSPANGDEEFDLLQDLRLPLDRSANGSSSPATIPNAPLASDDYYIFS
ncbi:hypothetical protein DERP_000393 [Dermatophagoides pteronyssinus]|uniref:Rab-GAP TBC domain-containing protein n=1 Tax=Dermatophagoides pteronyssinus TaxID=6956 RepID=A0ABQ8J025_DERPT|nr:hypothetical protein DERP_000393 [Dermatophagoides pteronyssinus]